MALQTLQLTAGNGLPPCSLSNMQVLLTQEKQREGRAFGDVKLLNETCTLSLCKGNGLLPYGLVSPTLASRNWLPCVWSRAIFAGFRLDENLETAE